MRKLLCVLAVGVSAFLQASPSSFPSLSLYSLQGEKRLLPSGRKELVFVGCRGDARQALSRWYQLFCDSHERVGRIGVMVVPVFPSFMSNRFFRNPLLGLIRQRIPDHLLSHVGVLFSNRDEIASLFHVTEADLEQLQVFFVSEKGEILWKTSGEPTLQSLGQLKQCMPADCLDYLNLTP